MLGVGVPAFAQDTTTMTPAPRSTLSGVFTTEQASRGRNQFLGQCKSCHAPESQTGANFARLWGGKPLLDFFKFVSEKMPENDPGTLAPETNIDIIAYVLQLNAMPTGSTELAADTTALRETRIELKDQPTKSDTTSLLGVVGRRPSRGLPIDPRFAAPRVAPRR